MDDLEEIKQKLDIVSLLGEYIPLKKTGRNFKACCPFHQEKTASFIVSPEKQIWHCFGCQKGGDIFGFYMEMEKVDFPEALRDLAKKAGITLSRTNNRQQATDNKERLYEINHLTSEFYHWILLNHKAGKKALEYITKRGITKDSLKLFSLGYSPNQSNALYQFLARKKYTDQEMISAGVIRSKNYDMFRGRLMFSLKDHRGKIVGFAGRTLDPNVKESKYINTAETPIYHKSYVLYGLDVAKDYIRKENAVVAVEGEIDCIKSFQAGVKNVVAIKGSALTEGQVALIKRYTENVILSLDMDLAGDAAARRGIIVADNAGLNIKVVQINDAKDPDELISKDPGAWEKAIKKAVDIYDFVIESAVKRNGTETAVAKKNVVNEVASWIIKINNPVVYDHYLKRLARILDISEEAIALALAKVKKEEVYTQPRQEKPQTPSIDHKENIESYLLSLLLQGNLSFPEEFNLQYLKTNINRRIAEELIVNKKKYDDLPEELKLRAGELFLVELNDVLAEPEKLKKEVNHAIKNLLEDKKREEVIESLR